MFYTTLEQFNQAQNEAIEKQREVMAGLIPSFIAVHYLEKARLTLSAYRANLAYSIKLNSLPKEV